MHHDLSLERLNNYLLCKLGILRTRMASESIGWNSTICFFFLVFLVSSLPFFCLRVILKIGSSFDVPLSGCTASWYYTNENVGWSASWYGTSKQCLVIRVKDTCLAFLSSPSSLTSPSFVIMTFGGRRDHQTPIHDRATLWVYPKQPIIQFIFILQAFSASPQQMYCHRHIPWQPWWI